MNKSEKQRAKLIEKMIISASPICSMKVLMVFSAVISAEAYALLFMFLLKSNELWVAIWAGSFLAFTLSADLYFIGAMYEHKNNVFNNIAKSAANGTYNTAEFAATLPLKATDSLYCRLIRCKKQVLTMGILTSAFAAAMAAAGHFGYETYDGVVGIAVLTTVLLEIIFIAASLLCRSCMRGMLITSFSAVAVLFGTMFLFETPDDIFTDQASELSVKLGGLSVLSGVTGIIILAVMLFAVVIIAELLVSRVKNISWKLD